MQKCENKTIQDEQGGIDLKSTQLPARRAFKLLTKLGKLLSHSLVDVKHLNVKDTDSIISLLMALFNAIDPDESDALLVQILEGTLAVCNGKAVSLSSGDAIDAVFSGRLMAQFSAMAFALEVNYRDFFRELTAVAAAKQPPPPTPAPPSD